MVTAGSSSGDLPLESLFMCSQETDEQQKLLDVSIFALGKQINRWNTETFLLEETRISFLC